jgi:lysophospholipase L1-like esterase
MTVKSGKLTILSYLFNVLLLLTGIFFALKRWHFQYVLDHPAKLPSYLRNPQYAEQLNIEPAYIRPVKIVMLGTSHVYKAHWDELLHRSDIGNRGIGSDITEGYLHRLQYVLGSHPQICFLEGGANDIEQHIPIDTVLGHIQKIVDTLSAAHIIPVLHTVFYAAHSYPGSDYFNDRVTALNKKILALAERRHLGCIDLNKVIAPARNLLSQYGQPDGIHLNATAYLRWKVEIEKILKRYNI